MEQMVFNKQLHHLILIIQVQNFLRVVTCGFIIQDFGDGISATLKSMSTWPLFSVELGFHP